MRLEPRVSDGNGGKAGSSTGVLRRVLGGRTSSSGVSPVRFQIIPAAPEKGEKPLARHTDPMDGFLQWMTSELVPYIAERKRASGWKYLVDWIALIRTVRLHHELPRPSSRETDRFDLVTFEESGKVLHVCERVSEGTLEAVDRFVLRAIAAKTARIKTGDIGAAILIAPELSQAALEAYGGGEREEPPWEMAMSELHTGYEGFVRLGPRRGFHLLLVQERDGRFHQVLPDIAGTRS